MAESGLAQPGKHMKAKLARAQAIRETPEIDDSLSELSARGKSTQRSEDWRDKSKLVIEGAVSVRSLANSKDDQSNSSNVTKPSTPRWFKVPHSRIPCFPRNKVLPPSRQSRSHSPILLDHPQSAK